jgi:hypothetical protein
MSYRNVNHHGKSSQKRADSAKNLNPLRGLLVESNAN